ncbi:hypothetical protein D1007_14381 [Hordeum vulgare]|uniref:Uncharacterized protein n=1 Tax=Hordeum vulgare subsp. vulgare TaxID=112509 RepID=A0A287M8F0_HORVV|nr:uncharacterized protein LOC123440624 [Hordeum vulgare subsp. vulgare]KAE8808961.1 hypothetical protein D1007_14381 [Hordeum vulgare]KAI5006933.1 hypothetical protein ZWY2020_046881 [Hordeum vulgare]
MSALVPPPPAFPDPQIMVPVAYGGAGGTAAESGSYGPVIAMLAVLAVLAALAVAVGRLCFGRRALGRAGGHDLEAWVEQKCGPCVGVGMHSPAAAAASDPAKQEEGDETAAPAEQPPEGTERGECSGSGSAGGS